MAFRTSERAALPVMVSMLLSLSLASAFSRNLDYDEQLTPLLQGVCDHSTNSTIVSAVVG